MLSFHWRIREKHALCFSGTFKFWKFVDTGPLVKLKPRDCIQTLTARWGASVSSFYWLNKQPSCHHSIKEPRLLLCHASTPRLSHQKLLKSHSIHLLPNSPNGTFGAGRQHERQQPWSYFNVFHRHRLAICYLGFRDMRQCLNASSFYSKCALSTAPLSQKVKAKLQAISYCLEQELATSSAEGRP